MTPRQKKIVAWIDRTSLVFFFLGLTGFVVGLIWQGYGSFAKIGLSVAAVSFAIGIYAWAVLPGDKAKAE